MSRRARRGVARALAVVAVAGVGAGAGAAVTPPWVAEAAGGSCPALYVLGVQGTDQSSSSASTTTDSGMLGTVMSPLLSMAASTVQRAYVPYPASFGGATASKSDASFQQSSQVAVDRTVAMTKQVAAKCPDTKFAYTGYSQGAYAISTFLQKVGQGQGPIPADRVAAGALLGDPTRPEGAGPFPGTSETRPSPPPDTEGKAVESLPAVESTAPAGGGIGPTQDHADYGQLAGRVYSACQSGDLACDAPSNSPVVHLVTNIAGQSTLDQKDPVKSLSSVAQALALTAVKTAVPVINEDLSGDTVEDLSYQPGTSISQRLATASDPRTPLPTIDQGISALMKVGTIGFNAVTTVVKSVLTPDTIAALAATGLTNPPAALAVLAAKVPQAVVQLVPPATADRWTNEAFSAVQQNVSDNSDLLDVANLTRYWATAQEHQSYSQPSMQLNGMSATRYIATWFAAVAADLAGKSFSAGDQAATLTADPSLAPTPAVVPSVPESLSDSAESSVTTTSSAESSTSGSTPTASTSETEAPVDSTETITDTPSTTAVPAQ